HHEGDAAAQALHSAPLEFRHLLVLCTLVLLLFRFRFLLRKRIIPDKFRHMISPPYTRTLNNSCAMASAVMKSIGSSMSTERSLDMTTTPLFGPVMSPWSIRTERRVAH